MMIDILTIGRVSGLESFTKIGTHPMDFMNMASQIKFTVESLSTFANAKLPRQKEITDH